MTLERQYAQALFELIHTSELSEESVCLKLLENLERMLAKKGHQKLLPRIYREYQAIEEIQKRREKHTIISPEEKNTRMLVELYRTLVT